MKTVTQRVLEAEVTIEGKLHSQIDKGLLILIGIEDADGQEDIDWLVNKLVGLRVFNDKNGVMNRSVADVDGEVMVISQFTLQASTKKGNRPSYIKAARPETAIPLYEAFIKAFSQRLSKPIRTGEFGADMKVRLVNDGPVTIIIDSKNKI
jgi:D-tyrosyl-tRNA(Tyr) deacylase